MTYIRIHSLPQGLATSIFTCSKIITIILLLSILLHFLAKTHLWLNAYNFILQLTLEVASWFLYMASVYNNLKVDMPILTCIFITFNWLTLTSEMHFVKFHPEVASSLLSRGKRKYAPLGMRVIWKYVRNYFLVYQLISHFLSYLQNYKEFKAKILDLQPEKYGLSFDIKKCTSSGWALGIRM